jgi:hypothetical protein
VQLPAKSDLLSWWISSVDYLLMEALIASSRWAITERKLTIGIILIGLSLAFKKTSALLSCLNVLLALVGVRGPASFDFHRS